MLDASAVENATKSSVFVSCTKKIDRSKRAKLVHVVACIARFKCKGFFKATSLHQN